VDITSEHSFRACEALASPSAKMILARASLDASASAAKERSKLLGMMISNLGKTLPELGVNYRRGVILQAHPCNPSSPTGGDTGQGILDFLRQLLPGGQYFVQFLGSDNATQSDLGNSFYGIISIVHLDKPVDGVEHVVVHSYIHRYRH